MDELDQAAKQLAAARQIEEAAKADAIAAARDAAGQGLSEYVIADRLGVTRMTVRKWLGKQ